MITILDGKALRDEKAERLKAAISKRSASRKTPPTLAIIQAGDDQRSDVYVEQKIRFAERIGARVERVRFPGDVRMDELAGAVQDLNADDGIHGIIVQMPLPKHLDAAEVVEGIAPEKDVDGLTSSSVARLWRGDLSGFVPATAKGILALLDRYRIPLAGKRVTIVGRSELVGKPLAMACLARNATVTVCHSKTADLPAETRRADVLVVAIGKAKYIGAAHVIKGQTVVDVGISAAPAPAGSASRAVSGDVDLEAVKDIVGAISPVPGGVGPLTVACLFENLALAAGIAL